jgi:hypothetical protein
MTKPIPQREPMLALPQPKYVAAIDACINKEGKSKGGTFYMPNCHGTVGKWAESINYKKQYF